MEKGIPITGHTQLIGLIATPIRHSMSPAMHNAAFDQLGLDYVYTVFEVGKDELEAAVKGLKALGVRGWNVSMPNKSAIIPYLDEISEASRLCDSVNTVINDDGHLTGTVTDGIGWVRAMHTQGVDIRGKKMVLLGAGGAATAIMVQGAIDGLREIDVFNRDDEFFKRGMRQTRLVNEETGCHVTMHHLEDHQMLHQKIMDADILVNATSAGMKPQDDICLVQDEDLHDGLTVFDAVYNPQETLLLKKAKAANCKVIGGIHMMLYQGAESFKLWTHQEMPIEEVKKALNL